MTLNSELLSAKSAYLFFVFLLIIVSCLGIYWPGLSGIFLLDDYHNLSTLKVQGGVTDLDSFLTFVFGNNSGTLGRPVSMMSFLIDDQAWPGSPRAYKYTNLMIHMLCGMLIMAITYRISIALKTENNIAKSLALLCGAFWLFHPLNVSTTLYVIQRMTQLTSLFMLAGVLSYVYGRLNYDKKPALALLTMAAGFMLFGSLAVLSKENGVLLIIYILVIETTIFQNFERPGKIKIWLAVFVLLPLLVLTGYFASRGFYVNAYDMRNFTFGQRLLTESRILMDYLYSIVIPPLKGTGLIHDDIVISTGLFTPVTTFFAIIANLALVISAFYFRKQHPVYSFAVLWFYGGHLMESSFIPLELYFEHRNYLPMFGPIFGVFYYSLHFAQKKTMIPHARLALLVPAVLIVMSMVFTYQTSKIWGNPNSLFAIWAYDHPESLRAQRIHAQNLAINGYPEQAVTKLAETYEKFPHDISLPLEIINISCANGINSPFLLEDIGKLVKSARFTDSIWMITKNLVDSIVTRKCQHYKLEDAISLMAILESVEKIKLRDKTFAQMLFLHSDLYVLNRQLTPAMELLDLAYQYQKTVAIPLRQAELLISAGLYQEAAHYIDLAKQTDNVRKKFTPSKIGKITVLENSIKGFLQPHN